MLSLPGDKARQELVPDPIVKVSVHVIVLGGNVAISRDCWQQVDGSSWALEINVARCFGFELQESKRTAQVLLLQGK